MIDKTKWGVAEGPRFVTASGQLEVVARFDTKKAAQEYKRQISPAPRRRAWQFQYVVVRVESPKQVADDPAERKAYVLSHATHDADPVPLARDSSGQVYVDDTAIEPEDVQPVPGHKIRYFGGKTSGYSWSCSCGKRSDVVPWEDAFDRTCEAHSHLESFGIEIPRLR